MPVFGIDANVLTRKERTGTERYTLSLLNEMQKSPLRPGERVLLYASEPVNELDPLPDGWEWRIVAWPFKKGWTHGALSLELTRRTPNVFFTPAHEIPLFSGRTKKLFTVHDVAFKRQPDLYTFKGRKRQAWAIRRAVKNADHFLAVSQTTKDDLFTLYGVPEEKVTVARLAVDVKRFSVSGSADALEKYNIDARPYVFSVGRIEHKKNINLLLDVFAGMPPGIQLILAGSFGDGSEDLRRRIQNMPDNVRALGYVPDAFLPSLMRRAAVFAFPSKYEGFGIPLLEAMAAETPVAASDIPALREVGGNAVLFLPPDNRKAWKRGISDLLMGGCIAPELVENGRMRVREFSWSRTAEKTWRVLRSLV